MSDEPKDQSLAGWIREKKNELYNFPWHHNPSLVSYIIIHHSLTSDGKEVNWEAIRRYHTEVNGWKDIGYHWGLEAVKDDYQIMLGREMNVRGAHVGDGGFNRTSIGICLVGNFDKFEPPQKQWILALMFVNSLIAYLATKNIIIPSENVIGHREAQALAGLDPAFRKSCPGNRFDMSRFRKELISQPWLTLANLNNLS